ncbi:MAG: phosphoribosylaminoimidazolesuccinocarboxamide synthase [Candidatus Humimicrobiaceae bacterium]|jgi:phosphoribosylaminoimidazole-succinocarboxamide synthase|nr:phosphoribosylaminoimidazolesuccinocarboxamide synthase [Actinomycetota bacterium]MDY0027928.1 phosphoribosylaminoimidazolesuccinocarboxamide synthase [Candidatus Humimicrobiaceae bacterium]
MKLIGDVEISGLEKLRSGKVREMFSFDDRILIVTTDRISAFDFILPSLIPYKGIVLNKISNFWFNYLQDIIDNHLIETDFEKFPKFLKKYKDILSGRSVIAKKVKVYPIECVVRGYITGSAWEEYKKTGMIGDLKLPSGLSICDRLPEAIFTPTTKEISGHDIALTINKAKRIFGAETVKFLKEKSIELYLKASEYAMRQGIIIADTKFEFGTDGDRIILVDEVLTPDSSRFWPLDEYRPGQKQKSFDKQFVRDYLLSTDWDRKTEPPELPDDVIKKTSERYIEAYEKITGEKFE